MIGPTKPGSSFQQCLLGFIYMISDKEAEMLCFAISDGLIDCHDEGSPQWELHAKYQRFLECLTHEGGIA